MTTIAARPTALDLARALIRCESVTPDDGGALAVLEGVLRPAGFTCHRLRFSEIGTPDIDNLYARLGTGRPHLCFAGHTDVVPPGDARGWSVPPFSAEVRDDQLIGRGAADMKGGIACFVAAALAFADAYGGQIPGSISLLITGDEEGPSINGTKKVLAWMAARNEIPDAAIVGEPTNPERLGDAIKIGRRGSLNGHLVVRGVQGHVAYPELAKNPMPALLRALSALVDLPLDEGTAHFAPSNLEITGVDVGNRAVNVIPAQAEARFNIRFNDRHTLASLQDRTRHAIAHAIGADPVAWDLNFQGSGEAFVTTPGALVETLRGAIEGVTGRTPELSTSGGTSDARFIKDYCPVVEFGLVNATIHKIDERVAVRDIEQLTEIYWRFLGAYFAKS